MDESKLARQQAGATIWGKTGKGTLEYVMRFGKTYTAILIIKRIRLKKPDSIIRIVVPSDWIRNNWYEELARNGISDVFVNTATETLNDGEELICDLLIIDEIHRFGSENRRSIINGELIKYKWILGLTGTYPSGEYGKFVSNYCPIVDTIDEHEALEKHWISQFIEYNYALSLDEETKFKYEQYSTPIRETLDIFKGASKMFGTAFRDDYDLLTSCFAGKLLYGTYCKAAVIRNQLADKKGWTKELPLTNSYNKMLESNWNPNTIEERAKQFNDIVRKRNELINNNSIKLKAVIELFNKFKLTTIVFNESIDFADAIADELNVNEIQAICYHSKIESRYMLDATGNQLMTNTGKPKKIGKTLLKREALAGLKNGSYKLLSTARALDEGLDVPNIEVVITTAGTANPLQYAQRNARGKTVDIYNPNKVTKIINLYFDDFYNDDGKKITSRDRSKLILRQVNANIRPVEVSNVDEI